MNLRPALHPFVQNALILLSSGVIASVLCAKVYGATLPVEEPTAQIQQPAATVTAEITPAANDAEAAAQLRAMLRGHRSRLVGPSPVPAAEPSR